METKHPKVYFHHKMFTAYLIFVIGYLNLFCMAYMWFDNLLIKGNVTSTLLFLRNSARYAGQIPKTITCTCSWLPSNIILFVSISRLVCSLASENRILTQVKSVTDCSKAAFQHLPNECLIHVHVRLFCVL